MSFCTQLCGVEWGYALYGYANEVYNYFKFFDEIELSYQELGYVWWGLSSLRLSM